MTLRFEPLTEEALMRYYGEVPGLTMRGRALMRGDEVVGVFGIYRYGGHEIAFSRVNDDLWQKPPPVWFKRVIISGMREIIRMRKPNMKLYAYAEPSRPNSDQLLEHFGFEHHSGRVYVWP